MVKRLDLIAEYYKLVVDAMRVLFLKTISSRVDNKRKEIAPHDGQRDGKPSLNLNAGVYLLLFIMMVN
ncbi:hypothetical protein H5410_038136 [Solanum commersonii]|uniref:Uncharacterized protein n=1 Tax=Solanum commersonii TaxID=4109 RepID=A0A9J5YBG8_SOLCO|nr:hypothetical protein H5410_038136 [Solanum commersonii]